MEYLNIYHNSFNNETGIGTVIVIASDEDQADYILKQNIDRDRAEIYRTQGGYICIVAAVSMGNPRFIMENYIPK